MQMQKNAKSQKNATYKGNRGSKTKKGRSKWFKNFLRRLRRQLQAFFSRHKMQEFLPGKSRKMQKNATFKGEKPLGKKGKKKGIKNATTQQKKCKMAQNAKKKKCKKNNNAFAYLAPHCRKRMFSPSNKKHVFFPQQKKPISNPAFQGLVDFFRKIHSLHNRAANRLLRKKKKNTTTEAPPTWIFFFGGGRSNVASQ